MYFELTNGEQVNLRGNTEAAKFVMLVMPRKGLKFVGNKPTIKITPEVRKLMLIDEKLYARQQARNAEIDRQCFDDDIPF